jgi:hypothetical protein
VEPYTDITLNLQHSNNGL